MEYKNRSEIFDACAQTNPDLAHSHESFYTGFVVPDDAQSAAETRQDQIDVGIGEYGVTCSAVDLHSGIRLESVELSQHLLTHSKHVLAALFEACVSEARGRAVDQGRD